MARKKKKRAPTAKSLTEIAAKAVRDADAAAKKIGRPTKLTPELVTKVADYVSQGVYREVAAAALGIGTTTFYRWLEIGEKAESGLYRDFWEAVKKAEATAEALLTLLLHKHAVKNHKAVVELLSRRFPKNWARKDNVTIDGEVSVVNADDLAAKIARLAAAGTARKDPSGSDEG